MRLPRLTAPSANSRWQFTSHVSADRSPVLAAKPTWRLCRNGIAAWEMIQLSQQVEPSDSVVRHDRPLGVRHPGPRQCRHGQAHAPRPPRTRQYASSVCCCPLGPGCESGNSEHSMPTKSSTSGSTTGSILPSGNSVTTATSPSTQNWSNSSQHGREATPTGSQLPVGSSPTSSHRSTGIG